MNHIGDVNKLVSDTPRTDKAWKTTHSVYEFTVEMKRMERELNAANDRIRLLIAERDTARRQADQHYKLREEFRELLGTDDVEQGVAVVRGLKERIKRLEEAGDAILNANNDDEEYEAIKQWYKAKEAKP